MDLNISDPEQIKKLIAVLQQLLPPENKEDEDDEQMSSKIKTKTRRSGNKNKKNSNKFLNMPEMRMHKEDCAVDQKLAKSPPTPRTRRYEPVEVRCRSCGKKEKVNPNIIPESVDRYKCNKCSAMAGG